MSYLDQLKNEDEIDYKEMNHLAWYRLGNKDIVWTFETKKGNTEEIFEKEKALALLLATDQVFLNSHYWEKAWPDRAQRIFSINVNCNDIFAWGCADAEEMTADDLRNVYNYYNKDNAWGTAIWCMIKRREMPQRPVEEAIREKNIWDLDELKKEFGLRSNYYDGVSHVIRKMEYDHYSAWKISKDIEPAPFGPGWWEGWKEFEKSNPNYYNNEWKKEQKLLIDEWKINNGYSDQEDENK